MKQTDNKSCNNEFQPTIFKPFSLSDKEEFKFTFIDLFAGIGGFHLAASQLGGKCVFASEIDEKARQVYQTNFIEHNPELFHSGNFSGDITKVNANDIPDFDFLFAGFPCQPFSKGGQRKGFEDTRGTLFFDIARIVKENNPKYILLEYVQNLVTHNNGITFKTILNILDDLGYATHKTPLILSPDDFGVLIMKKMLAA